MTPTSSSPTRVVIGASMANPIPVALGLFGFALAIYSIRYLTVTPATLAAGPGAQALNYALLAAALAEMTGGILGIIRGIAYPAYVTCMFAFWLLGLYFLITLGGPQKDFTTWGLGWFALMLNVPVIIMAVPAFVHRNPTFIVAFVAIIVLLFLFGFGYIDVFDAVAAAGHTKTAPDLWPAAKMLRISSYFGFLAAAAIWWAFGEELYRAAGVLPPMRQKEAEVLTREPDKA